MMNLTHRFPNNTVWQGFMLSAAVVFVAVMSAMMVDIRLVALLSVIPCFAVLFYRHPLLLLYLFPILNVGDLYLPLAASTAGGFQLQSLDPLYAFTLVHLGLCAVLQPRKLGQALKENKLLILFLAIIALYVVLYMPVFGWQRAIGETRKVYFMFLIPLLASVAIRQPEDLRRFILVMVWAAIGAAILGLGQAAMRGTTVNAINSETTLILAFGAFAILVHRIYRMVIIGPVLDRVLLFLFTALVVASGQRSVWLAVGFGLALMLWFYRRRSSVMVKTFMIGGVAVFALTAALAVFPQAGSRLADRLGGIIDPYGDQNASWRIQRWQQNIDRVVEDGKLLFGEGFGGYYRDPITREMVPSPHNVYIQLVVKVGLFGLFVYGLVAFEFFRKTLRARKKLAPGPMRAYLEIGLLTVGAAHAFGLGYGFIPIILMFFAVGVSAAKLSRENLRRLRPAQRKAVHGEPQITPGWAQARSGPPSRRAVEVGPSGTVRGPMFGVRR